MAAGSGVDSVWIGFMDMVPVIGTVKEAVELVLALYEGNNAVVKEKETAIKKLLKESFKKHVKMSTAPAAAATPTSDFSGLRNVSEVRKEKIIEHMMKGSKRPPKISQAEQKKREKRVEEIKRDMLEKIRIVKPDFKRELEEEMGRSGRGEHVFNNNILRFHSKVLDDFIGRYHITNIPMNELRGHTLDQNTATEIQTNMVVHFESDEFYVNANGVMYGVYCQELHTAFFDVLGHINPHDVTEEHRNRLNFVIDNMNNLEIYVDQLAKVRWIDNRGVNLARFEAVRQRVATMYRTNRGLDWSILILQTAAPYFGH